jgi:hypothetical protein
MNGRVDSQPRGIAALFNGIDPAVERVVRDRFAATRRPSA